MNQLKEIIAMRAAPGVLILDLEDRLLYSNQEAVEMLCALNASGAESKVPREIYELCAELWRGGAACAAPAIGVIRCPAPFDAPTEVHFALRALPLGHHGDGDDPSHVMVLMEKVIRNRGVDLEKARRDFGLSKRELDVVHLVCQGLANKEIASAIFVSEFTVKDHLKNIMRKMEVSSRSEIVANLL